MSKTTPYWTRVCLNAIKRKRQGKTPFSKRHIRLAKSWDTCACGKQDPSILRWVEGGVWNKCDIGKPQDRVLADYGWEFCKAVEAQAPTKALRIVGNIERRAVEVMVRQEVTP